MTWGDRKPEQSYKELWQDTMKALLECQKENKQLKAENKAIYKALDTLKEENIKLKAMTSSQTN